jgi:hypothetical protein
VELVGIHAHIGSQVFVAGFFEQAIEALAPFVNETGLPELSIGGGIGVAYVEGEEAPSITEWGAVVRGPATTAGITARVSAEPGRAIAAAAGITVYRVGTVKEVPGIRTFVAVDGGFIDNPRPALYGSGYETFDAPGSPHPAPRPCAWWASTASRATSSWPRPRCRGPGGRRSHRHPGHRGLRPVDGLQLQPAARPAVVFAPVGRPAW